MSLFSEPSNVVMALQFFAGFISAFVKWGAEHPFPPRSPIDFTDLTGSG